MHNSIMAVYLHDHDFFKNLKATNLQMFFYQIKPIAQWDESHAVAFTHNASAFNQNMPIYWFEQIHKSKDLNLSQ
jgi:hypothetical protein